MAGVSINRTRKQTTPDVTIVSPYGTLMTVSAARADSLLNRPAIAFGDGVFRKYALEGEDTVVPTEQTKATGPRVGTRANTEGGDK